MQDAVMEIDILFFYDRLGNKATLVQVSLALCGTRVSGKRHIKGTHFIT